MLRRGLTDRNRYAVARQDERHCGRHRITCWVGCLDLVAERRISGVCEDHRQRRAGSNAVAQVDTLEVGLPQRLGFIVVSLQVRT